MVTFRHCFSHLNLLLVLFFVTICQIPSVTCNTYYILTASANDCPQPYTWEQCTTLEGFASTVQTTSTDVLLILEPGTHTLNTRIHLTQIRNFTMVPSIAGTKPTIPCSTRSNSLTQDIEVYGVSSHIQIQGVAFEGCLTTFGTTLYRTSGNSVLISDVSFSLESELTVRNILESVQLLRVNFTDCTLSHISTFINSTRIRMEQLVITRTSGIQTSGAAEISLTDSVVRDLTDSPFLLIDSPNVSVARCHFLNNDITANRYIGGGLNIQNVEGIISESVFHNNRALSGSAISARIGTNLTIDHCNFTSNGATQYGAIEMGSNNLTVTNCIFDSNTALYGAGIAAIGSNMLYVSNCSFHGNNKQAIFTRLVPHNNVQVERSNFTLNVGGGVYGGGAIATDRTPTLFVFQSLFVSNTASLKKGGAINVADGGVLTLVGCNFIANSASLKGGAVYVTGSLIAVVNRFTNNRALDDGGAVSVKSYVGSVNMSYCNLTDNASQNGKGGALHVDSQHLNVNIDHSFFVRNTATGEVGSGGVIYLVGEFTNISLMDSTFDSNSASSCGVVGIGDVQPHRQVEIIRTTFTSNRATGQGNTDGGGVLCVSVASISLTDCTVNNNSAAQHGGVLYVDNSNIRMDRCSFINNAAGQNGGVAYTNTNPATYSVRLSIFSDNSAGGDGGAIYLGIVRSRVIVERSSFGSNSAGSRGGMVAINGSQLVIDNQTNIFDNAAPLGPAISACNSEVDSSSELVHTGSGGICQYYTADINSFNISELILEELSTTTVAETMTTSPITTVSTEQLTTQETTQVSINNDTTTRSSRTTTRETQETPENTHPSPPTRPHDRTTTPPIGTVNVPDGEPSTDYGKTALAVAIVSLVLTLCLFVLVGGYLTLKVIVVVGRRHAGGLRRDSDSTELLMEDKT